MEITSNQYIECKTPQIILNNVLLAHSRKHISIFLCGFFFFLVSQTIYLDKYSNMNNLFLFQIHIFLKEISQHLHVDTFVPSLDT